MPEFDFFFKYRNGYFVPSPDFGHVSLPDDMIRAIESYKDGYRRGLQPIEWPASGNFAPNMECDSHR